MQGIIQRKKTHRETWLTGHWASSYFHSFFQTDWPTVVQMTNRWRVRFMMFSSLPSSGDTNGVEMLRSYPYALFLFPAISLTYSFSVPLILGRHEMGNSLDRKPIHRSATSISMFLNHGRSKPRTQREAIKHMENKQTPYTKPERELNPWPWRCGVTVLTATPTRNCCVFLARTNRMSQNWKVYAYSNMKLRKPLCVRFSNFPHLVGSWYQSTHLQHHRITSASPRPS